MNQFSQVKQNGLETFVSNLNNLYIELLIDDALKSQQKQSYQQAVEQSLIDHDKESFTYYTDLLAQLEEM